MTNADSDMFQAARRWLGPASAITAIGGLLISFFLSAGGVTSRDFDLVLLVTVWSLDESPLSADDLRLASVDDGAPQDAARIIRVEMFNLGKNFIGIQERLWHLDIVFPTTSVVALIKGLPDNNVVIREVGATEKNIISLEVGVIPSRAGFDLLIEATNVDRRTGRPNFTTDLHGLPVPIAQPGGLEQQLRNRLGLPVLVVVAPIYLIALVWSRWRDWSKRLEESRLASWGFAGELAVAVLVTVIGSLILSFLIVSLLGVILSGFFSAFSA